MTREEQGLFIMKHKGLPPYKVREFAEDHLEKAKVLMEVEISIDRVYSQMDFKTMSGVDRDRMTRAVSSIDEAIKVMRKLRGV